MMQDIVVKHLCKTYGAQTVLNDMSLRFPHGKVTCIMAPSGYGKTTLLRILMGLETADSGTIAGLEGMTFGPVFQESRLCENLSAIANIMLVSPKLDKSNARNILARVGLDKHAEQLVKTMSGGMRRRVALVRALASQRDVLLMDEPFKGLDLQTKQQVMAVALACCRGKTTIMSTHDLAEAQWMAGENILHLDQ